MNFREAYEKNVVPQMMKTHGFSSPLAVPRITKIVVHTGVGRIRDDKEIETIRRQLSLIAGQKPSPRKAKKSIASFKSREGMVIGLAATLRRKRMYDFLTRLISVALPRARDFWGISEKSVDEGGNLTIGIKEHIIFPEAAGEDVRTIFGLEVTVVPQAASRELALEMYRLLGIPFKK